MSITLPKIADRNGEIGKGASITEAQRKSVADYIRARRVAAEAAVIAEKLKAGVQSIVGMAGGSITMLDAIVRLGPSVSYDYPATITRLEDKLRKEKKIMQLDGRAQKIEKLVLMFSDQRTAA